MRERYPARSKLRRSERLYDCAPQLDYDTFVDGTFEDQLREYIRGIEESAFYLGELGATSRQVDEFRRILKTVVARLLTKQPGGTRH